MHQQIVDTIKGKRVAIVGNAASLLSDEFGKEIDAHDFIVRFGKGAPDAFNAKSVGTRTDLWCTTMFRCTKSLHAKFNPKFTLLNYAQIGLYQNPPQIAEPIQPDFFWDYDSTMGTIEDHLRWASQIECKTGRPSQGALFAAYMKEHLWHEAASSITFYGFDFFEDTFEMKGKPTASWHCPIMRKEISEIPHDTKAERRFIMKYIATYENVGIWASAPLTQEQASTVIQHYRGKK